MRIKWRQTKNQKKYGDRQVLSIKRQTENEDKDLVSLAENRDLTNSPAGHVYSRDIHKMIKRVERGASGVETHSKSFFLLSVEDLSVSL